MDKLKLAMLAGARAIQQSRRLDGTIYVYDVFGNPEEISYYEAMNVLREEALKEEQPCAEWICVYGKDRHGSYHQYKCSNCGDKLDYPKKYCPGCGRRMRNDLD